MAYSCSYIRCSETGFFSRLVTDYLNSAEHISPFYTYATSPDGLNNAIKDRQSNKVNRIVLTNALNRQYASLTQHPKVEENIKSLLSENTFTVCTAHQPNLLTGYLYFVYKILHAVKLANELNDAHPGKHFVPVYYMGSEDNDLEELGVFRFRGDKYVWDGNGQKGAVGRMDTAGLKTMINDLFKVFGPPGPNCEQLKKIFTEAYLKHKTIGSATQYLVNELFGQYGLIVLDPDDASLKALFIPVMEDELLNQSAYPVIAEQLDLLASRYKIQAHPREINLFYLAPQLRERIEMKGDRWVVVNTDITWSRDELLKELYGHPERFSPNVMLRGLFQETILPDVAFIGGGAEVAYWMQLKTLFAQYNGFFPVIYLRQSVLWIDKLNARTRQQLELTLQEIFKPGDDLANDYVIANTHADWSTGKEATSIEEILKQVQEKAEAVDSTLGPSAGATLSKIKQQLANLEKKMLRAEKRKMEVQLARISKLKNNLFPNGSLQERVKNFSEYYLQYGGSFFDTLLNGTDTSGGQFLVVTED